MATSATKKVNGACEHAPLRGDQPWYLGIAKKMVIVAVLVIIAAMPVGIRVSAPDNTGAASHVALYYPPHIPHTIDSDFETRMNPPRNRSPAFQTFDDEFRAAQRLASQT